MITNKETFKQTIELYKKHPWLERIEDRLLILLFEDCKDGVQRELIFNLINEFFYMEHKNYIEHIKSIAEEIISFNCEETLIYSTACDRETDSSQEITYLLKPKIAELGGVKWQKPNLYGNMSKSVLRKHDENIIKNIFVVDEFNGSGQTIISRYKKICRDLEEKGKSPEDFNIKFFYISSMYDAHIKVDEEGILLDSKEVLAMGISDNDSIKDKDKAKDIIINISKILSVKLYDEEMLPLGYNNAEALYCRENGNTPNNVFPIFWWPQYIDGGDRNSLLIRGF